MAIERTVLRAARCLIIGSLIAVSASAAADTLVFSAAALILRSDLDGANVEEIWNSGLQCFVEYLTVDAPRHRVYATELCTNQFTTCVLRVNADGTDPQVLVIDDANSVFSGIGLDSMQGKMYFGVVGPGRGVIKRADLDGSNVETVVANAGCVSGMALDAPSGLLYWAAFDTLGASTGRIRRANLATREVIDLVEGLGDVVDVAIDTVSNELYFVDVSGRIQKASLIDGGSVQDVLTDLTRPRRIALDLGKGKLYWTDNFEQKIQRANLDGSNREDVLSEQALRDLDLILDTVAIEARTWGRIKSRFR